jgi:sterol desaturase/sphingolipid hydroxylase (fatty acid hydroxylase superfamily)
MVALLRYNQKGSYMVEKMTFEKFQENDFQGIIQWAAPLMIFLVLLEYYLSSRKNRGFYSGKDLMASIGVGAGSLVVNIAMKIGVFFIFWWFYNLTPLTIPQVWWSYVLCFFFLDFCRYWAHRIAHEQRFWWSTHVVHHSSEFYNLAVSFRLSWTQNLKIIFFLPVILIGFDPFVFLICHQIAVLYQFWIHTEYIKKLPAPIEYVFTTPSHHRVHHSTNDNYIDKNYGSTFIIWDRMFGTFEPEVEKPVYGITKPVNSFNPVYLVFHAWGDLFGDIFRAKSFREVVALLFASPTAYERQIMRTRAIALKKARKARMKAA